MTRTLRWVAAPMAAAAALLIVSVSPAAAFVGSSTDLGEESYQSQGQDDDAPLPLIPHGSHYATSPIWSGYAALGAPGTYETVQGSWTVPSVTCAPGENSTSITWVGIDGAGNRTVEQIGTEQGCYSGQAVYRTFYEMFPSPPVFDPGFNVSPGDQVTAEVRWVKDNTFHLSLKRHGDGDGEGSGLNVMAPAPTTAARATAEAIFEIPPHNATPNVSGVDFDNVSINDESLADSSPVPVVRFLRGAPVYVPTIIDEGRFSVRRV